MNNQNLNIEKNQINKILQIYSQNKIKDALFQANYSKLKYPNLSRIPIFHNLLGLINLRLKDWENQEKHITIIKPIIIIIAGAATTSRQRQLRQRARARRRR